MHTLLTDCSTANMMLMLQVILSHHADSLKLTLLLNKGRDVSSPHSCAGEQHERERERPCAPPRRGALPCSQRGVVFNRPAMMETTKHNLYCQHLQQLSHCHHAIPRGPGTGTPLSTQLIIPLTCGPPILWVCS